MSVKTPQKPPAREVKRIVRDLTKENRPESPVVQILRRQVANSLVLYLNYKRYHWQTFGPHFRDLHKMFDQFAQETLESIDQIAERVRMIGQDPPALLPEIAELASVTSGVELSSMREMIEEARSNALIVIQEFRKGAKVSEEHEDPGSVDLCSKLVQVHEMHEWWLRDLLRGNDGLN